ncbi:MAG: hypothetical protein ACE5GM_02465 [bacterium]
MKNNIRFYLVSVFLACCLVVPSISQARRFGGGFGRGFGRAFSRGGMRWGGRMGGRSRPSRSLGRGGWGRSRSRGDRMLSRKTAQRGKRFASRKSAQSAYRNSHRMKNKFKSKPASRPEHIPSTVNRGGRNYNVSYYNGSYGYYNPLGVFVALTAADMLVTNAMMRSAGYGYGYGPYQGAHYYRSGGMSFWSGMLMFFLIIYIAGLIRKSKL